MILTAKHLNEKVGSTGMMRINGFVIPVKVLDVRQRFNLIDYQVEPIGGDGWAWVESSRVISPRKEKEGG